jgi:hypothetical protein
VGVGDTDSDTMDNNYFHKEWDSMAVVVLRDWEYWGNFDEHNLHHKN